MLLRRELLQAVRPAVTDQDTRYALDTIQITAEGSAVATNGHILIKATDPYPFPDADYPTIAGMPTNDPTTPTLIPSALVDKLVKAMPKRHSMPVLGTVRLGRNGDDGTTYAAVTDLQAPIVATIQEQDPPRQYPDYARVIPPADRPVLSIVLGVPVLEALIKSAKAIGVQTIRVHLPTDPAHQGAVLDETVKGHAFVERSYREHDRCATCGDRKADHCRPDGLIQSAITAEYGTEIKALAVMMPCRA